MRERKINRRSGHNRIGGHAVIVRGKREHISSNFISHIPIRGNTVGAEEDLLCFARLQKISRHVVANNFVRNAILLQFPGSQARALQARTGFIYQHMNFFALLVRGADNSQRGAPIDGGERAGVAVMNDRVAVVDQCGAVFRHALVDLHIFIGEFLRFIQDKLTQVISRAFCRFRSIH